MDMYTVMRAFAALILVLGLIGGLYLVLRRFSNLAPATGNTSDLKVVSWKPFDGRKRLAVIRWGDQEHLVITGQGQDVLIASRKAVDDVLPESGNEQ